MTRRGVKIGLAISAAVGGIFAPGGPASAEGEALFAEQFEVSRGEYRLEAPAAGQTYALPHKFLFAESEEVRVGDARWERGREYAVDYDRGTITVLASPPYAGPVVITYEYLPFLQAEEYRRALDEKENEAEVLERMEEEGKTSSQLDVTGSKTFSVAAGNAQGTDFDQSLRLSIKGNVGDVKITGEISDQSLPMEEGGATEELEAVDKVSVRVEGRHLAGTFGDYDVDVGGLRFADYQRRLTGIKAEAFYPTWEANAYGARARGRFATNEFYGQDGVQGPYQLSAREDTGIVVLADTETVWVNGVELKKGENNDYVVDYDLATVTFTARRPITAQDRVVVDFQYTTDEYQRDFFGGDAAAHFLGDAVNLGAVYVHEEDNRNRDLFGLTPVEREKLLPSIGDHPERARVPARDENGDIIYEYVGQGLGEYEREWDPIAGKYIYTFVGAGHGDYKPRYILLPLPKRQSLMDVTASVAPVPLLSVEAEGATSDLDANTFSALDDDDNTGLAGTATTTLRLHEWKPLRPVGELELSHTMESRDGRFRSLGREDDVAFLEKWDLMDEVAGLERPPAQNLYEITATERPRPALALTATYGALNQRYVGLSAGGYENQYAKRTAAGLTWEPEKWPHVSYDFNGVNRRGQRGAPPAQTDEFLPKFFLTLDENTLREQNAEISYSFWKLQPYVRGHDRRRVADYEINGSPDAGTIDSELEVGSGVAAAPGLTLKLGHTAGKGEKVADYRFAPYYRSRREDLGANYERPGLLSVNSTYTRIHKDFAPADEADADSDLSLVDVYYTPWERLLGVKTRYQLDSVREFEREEYFEVALDGDGDYRRVRDPKNPRRFIFIYDPEDPEAIYVKRFRNTGVSYRVLKPDLTATLDVQPYRRNDLRRDGVRDPWWDAAAAELYVHASQGSSSPRRFAVATLQGMLGDDVISSALEQRYTLTVLPVNRRVTGRVRYSHEDELDRTINARRYRRWRSSRYAELTTEPAERWTIESDVEHVREREAVAEDNVSHPQDTIANEMIYGLLPTYTPVSPLELKVRGEVSRRHEEYNGAPTRIDGVKIKPELIYRLAASGVADFWYERAQYRATGFLGTETLLFRIPGVSHKWEASVNKGVGKYVTLIFTYDGELRPDREGTRHRGQIDCNIYF